MSIPSPARLVRLHWSLLVAICVIGLAGWVTPGDWPWPTRFALGWDAGVAAFLIISGIKMARAHTVEQIRARAAALDDAGAAVLPLSLLAAVASVVIVIGEAVMATNADAGRTAVLTLGTVALSWCFIHLMFAQHYAHEFYAPGDGRGAKQDRGGLIFPGEDAPDYWDFIHFSLVIGVASQTADIQIADRALRRLCSIHSVMAFVFNTVILALTVNFAVNLVGK